MVKEHKGLFVLTVIAVLIVVSIGFYYFNNPTGMAISTGYAIGNPTFEIFYGSVSVDEILAEDGVIVSAEIQESGISESAEVSGGEYSLILEGGNEGEVVVFTVDGEIAGTSQYVEYDSTELNLAVGGAGDSDEVVRRTPSGSVTCTENWECGDWGDCVGSIQTRMCTDKNNCRTTTIKPEVKRECDSSNNENNGGVDVPGPADSSGDSFDMWFYIIIGVVLIIIIGVMLYWIFGSLKKKDKENLIKDIEKPMAEKKDVGIPFTSPEAGESLEIKKPVASIRKIKAPKKPTKEFFMKKK